PLPSTHILSAANSVLTVPSSFHDLSTTQIYTFPTRRSSDLYRSHKRGVSSMSKEERKAPKLRFKGFSDDWEQRNISKIAIVNPKDRKSTRLNSSHVSISYAVFCLKKKKNNNMRHHRVRALVV